MKRYRSEQKYCLSVAQMELVKQRVSHLLPLDSHADENGKYMIHSLYFDDYQDDCARENVSGDGIRFKYRIRYYGDDFSNLFLEKKEKHNSFCHKRSCYLERGQFDKIMCGQHMEVFWNTDNKLLKEFCIDCVTKRFLPKVIIDYERVAFVEKITNIRITFDYNISASREVEMFGTSAYLKVPILERDKHILEVKYDDVFPSYLKQVFQSESLIQQSFSKYYLGRIALQEKENVVGIR